MIDMLTSLLHTAPVLGLHDMTTSSSLSYLIGIQFSGFLADTFPPQLQNIGDLQASVLGPLSTLDVGHSLW